MGRKTRYTLWSVYFAVAIKIPPLRKNKYKKYTCTGAGGLWYNFLVEGLLYRPPGLYRIYVKAVPGGAGAVFICVVNYSKYFSSCAVGFRLDLRIILARRPFIPPLLSSK